MNKNIIPLIIITVLLVGCTPTGEVVKEKELEPIKIGTVLPLTGTSSYIGQYSKEGLELAKDEINSAGGIENRKIELIYEDNQGDTKQGISAYQKLTQINNIKIIVSALSHITLGIAPFAEEDKVIVLSIAGAAPKISEAGDYIFRHNLLPQEELRFLADFIYNKMNITRIGILGVNTESGVSYVNEFKIAFEELGGTVDIIEMYSKEEKDFRTYLLKIKDSEVKAVFNAGYANQAGLIMEQGKEYGLDFKWFSGYTIENPEFLEIAGDSANSIIYTHFMNQEDPLFRKYNEKFKVRYDKSSEAYAALAYDSLYILAEVIKQCSSEKDTECIKDKLYQVKDFQGVTGKISFDENGDTRKELVIKTVRNGEFVLY